MSTLTLDKDKKADLAGPGIGDYQELEKYSAAGLSIFADPERDAAGYLPGETLH